MHSPTAQSPIYSRNGSPVSSPKLKLHQRKVHSKPFSSKTLVLQKSGIDYLKKGGGVGEKAAEDITTLRDTMISELGVTCSSPTKFGRRLVTKTATEQLRNSTACSTRGGGLG